MSEQVDIAVDLGAAAPALPEILNLRQLVETAPAPPPQIIEGILHQGCKMILGGTSKSNKSWCLLDLALSVASGQNWWRRRCTKLSGCSACCESSAVSRSGDLGGRHDRSDKHGAFSIWFFGGARARSGKSDGWELDIGGRMNNEEDKPRTLSTVLFALARLSLLA
jgi:hypothetical protein